MPSHPPEAQSSPDRDSIRRAVRFSGSQDVEPGPAPRQETKLERLKETRESREHLGDPTPLPATRQGIFHWDSGDQIDALVEARDLDPERAYIPPALALCSMARTDPGNTDRYVRTNGPWSLIIIAGGKTPKLPYGSIPRLGLAWIGTEAVRTRSPVLVLGHSLTEFMVELGLNPRSGGRGSDRQRIQDQMERLLRASVELSYERDGITYEIADHITTERKLWWNPRRPDEPVLWNSEVRLGERFFRELIARPMPLDFHMLRALKRSSLGLDLYTWLTYRLFGLEQPEKIAWRLLYIQFAPHPEIVTRERVKDFKRKALRELGKIPAGLAGVQVPHGAGLPRADTDAAANRADFHNTPVKRGVFHAETAPPPGHESAQKRPPPRPRICAETAPPTYR